MRGPGIPANETRNQLVNNLDLVATIEDLAGITPGLAPDGRSLIPLLAALSFVGARVFNQYQQRSLEVFVARNDTAGQSAVWGNLGLLCENRGDFACALEAQQRSLAIDPRNSYAIHNIGALHEIQGDDALALDAYLRAAALDHEDGDAVHEAAVLVEAGRMQMHLGREPEAVIDPKIYLDSNFHFLYK
jgi:tetratricopeptide (TPR) repeat protein